MSLLIHDIKVPNGIAFSLDEKTLYASDIEPKRTSYLADDVKPDGMVTHGRVFFDATRWRNHPFFGPAGFKVNRQGNSVGARSGGLSMIASDGTLFDKDRDGEPTSSVARRGWADSVQHRRLIGLSLSLDCIRGSGLACIIHEGFYCDRGFAAATSLWQAGSPLNRLDILFKYSSGPRGSA